MKVTFPHMGNLWIVVKTVLEDLGVEVVVPPFPSRRSLDLGVRHAPEFACFPLKLNLGDFLGALGRGADVIVMAGGIGPCRFGHYAQVQSQVLRDLGYKAEMVVLEPPRGHFAELVRRTRYLTGNKPLGRIVGALRFGWEKLKALDELDRALAMARPRERGTGRGAETGSAARAHSRAVSAVSRAAGIGETRAASRAGAWAIGRAVARGGSPDAEGSGRASGGGTRDRPLRVGIVGEIFMVEEPFANQEVERRLGELGVEVTRALSVSDWVRTHLLFDALRLKSHSRLEEVKRAARPYLSHFVGGEGLESVGEAVLFSARGFDGVVHIAPFTCMPEIVARSLLPEIAQDLGLPVLSLFLDEHTAEAGLATRLEAFTDLLDRRRKLHRREEAYRPEAEA